MEMQNNGGGPTIRAIALASKRINRSQKTIVASLCDAVETYGST